jgi:hypothetical protein
MILLDCLALISSLHRESSVILRKERPLRCKRGQAKLMGGPNTAERDDTPHDDSRSPAWAQRCYAYHELYRARLANERERLYSELDASTVALSPHSERLAQSRWTGFSIGEEAGDTAPQQPMTPEQYAGEHAS